MGTVARRHHRRLGILVGIANACDTGSFVNRDYVFQVEWLKPDARTQSGRD